MDNFSTTLIALISGIIGAVFALIGNHLMSKRTAETQMKMTVLTNFMSARLTAYQEFWSALQTWSEQQDSASCSSLYCAAAMVSLVASDETISALSKIQDGVRRFETTGSMPVQPEWGELIVALDFSMHSDLTAYQAPQISL